MNKETKELTVKTASTQIRTDLGEGVEIAYGDIALRIHFNACEGCDAQRIHISAPGFVAAELDHATLSVQALAPGTVMPDGTIYAGTSPDTGRAFYAAAKDVPKKLSWYRAQSYAARCNDHGHSDWRLPTIRELNVLFNNRAAVGGFEQSGLFPAGIYRSSTQAGTKSARVMRFGNGGLGNCSKTNALAVRCVRG